MVTATKEKSPGSPGLFCCLHRLEIRAAEPSSRSRTLHSRVRRAAAMLPSMQSSLSTPLLLGPFLWPLQSEDTCR
jgi:hypothetical protein